ncbi:MAG TPA: hypothetical protein VF210_05875 [Pseudomonadales bacterium]
MRSLNRPRLGALLRRAPWLLLILAPSAAAQSDYDVEWHAHFRPEHGDVAVRLVVEQDGGRLTRLDFDAPEPRYGEFTGDGDIERTGDRLVWVVPSEGGELRYRVRVDHRRDDAWDARLTDDWAVVRLDDLFPPVRARSRRSAHARARLYLDGPDGWSFETPYGPVHEEGVAVETAGRRFDRPLGWMAAGELGIRRARIAGRRIAIAGPREQGFRRMDMLTFLSWTVPELVEVAPSLPERVLIVGGSREMWRGGLSGPGSLYVHPDRPLVSGNGTSTLLHELLHVAMAEPPEPGADWIVEGLAEYYSLAILLRSGGIDGRRFERSLASLEAWAREQDGRLTDPSSGADTARAVLLFRDLDLELRREGRRLDEVSAELLGGAVSVERLTELVERALGEPSAVLTRALRTLDRED